MCREGQEGCGYDLFEGSLGIHQEGMAKTLKTLAEI
jgi:hypothetical protein